MEGFEPSRALAQRFLRPPCLPVPAHPHFPIPPLRPLFILLSFLEISMFFQLLNFNQNNFNQNCAILKKPAPSALISTGFPPPLLLGTVPQRERNFFNKNFCRHYSSESTVITLPWQSYYSGFCGGLDLAIQQPPTYLLSHSITRSLNHLSLHSGFEHLICPFFVFKRGQPHFGHFSPVGLYQTAKSHSGYRLQA